MPILMFHQQRKEVIQCLIPSAVTSLGSPAKPVWLGNRALSAPGPASAKNRGATGEILPRPFYDPRNDAALKLIFKSRLKFQANQKPQTLSVCGRGPRRVSVI